MTNSTFALIELLLVFGAVIGWAVWQLWSVKRAPRNDASQRPPVADPRRPPNEPAAPGENQHD